MTQDWEGCDFCGNDDTLHCCGDYWLCGHCLEVMHAENLYYDGKLIINEIETPGIAAASSIDTVQGGEEE